MISVIGIRKPFVLIVFSVFSVFWGLCESPPTTPICRQCISTEPSTKKIENTENTENTIKIKGFRRSNTEKTENTIKIKVSAMYVKDMCLNYVQACPLRATMNELCVRVSFVDSG